MWSQEGSSERQLAHYFMSCECSIYVHTVYTVHGRIVDTVVVHTYVSVVGYKTSKKCTNKQKSLG